MQDNHVSNKEEIIEQEIFQIENSFNKIDRIYKLSKKLIKKIGYFKSEEFKSQYNNYKISVKMLLQDGDHFKLIREVCTKSEDDYDIWNSEHFDYVQKNLLFASKLNKLIILGIKENLINNFEYNMLKKIYPNINNVWKLDEIFTDLYLEYDYDVPTYQEVEYFFAFIDIILLKLEKINILYKKDSKKNISDILDDYRYLNNVIDLKNHMENEYIKKKLSINKIVIEESW